MGLETSFFKTRSPRFSPLRGGDVVLRNANAPFLGFSPACVLKYSFIYYPLPKLRAEVAPEKNGMVGRLSSGLFKPFWNPFKGGVFDWLFVFSGFVYLYGRSCAPWILGFNFSAVIRWLWSHGFRYQLNILKKRATGCLGYIGDEILPSYMGIILETMK